MNPKTLLVGFVSKLTKETPSQLRNKAYADEILTTYNLGKVTVCTMDECRSLLCNTNPDVVIVSHSCDADEVKKLKSEAVVYVVAGVSSVFSRKAEVEEKKTENIKKFVDAEETVKRIRDATDEEREQMRKFHAMSYNDTYKMIQKAIIGDNEDLRKKAWDLLWGPGEKSSNIIWMRVQMMAEVWEHSKGKNLEQLMLMSMERHIDQGTARKIDNFIDSNGQEYYQYMFLNPYGDDLNHIRRLPFATKDQDRYAYEALLERSEIPTNYMRVQLEATELRKKWDEHLEVECDKVRKVLDGYEKDPSKSKKELGVMPWEGDGDVKEPLAERDLESLKNFLKKYSDTLQG